MSKSLLLALALTAAIALPAAAQKTAVEAVHTARKDGADCPNLDTDFGYMAWKRGDGAIRIVGEGEDELEFWGHFMDLSGDASISGIPGATASLVKGRGGAENGSAKCPRIGSAVVKITIAPVTSPQNGTLAIGNERIPLTVLPRIAMNIHWTDDVMAYPPREPKPLPPLTPSQIRGIHNLYNSCVSRRNNPENRSTVIPYLTCEQARDVALRLIPDPRPAPRPGAEPKNLVRCADNEGLSTTLYPDGSVLLINLPDDRRRLMECVNGSENFLPVYIRHSAEDMDFHVFKVSQPNNLRMTATGTYPTLRYSRYDAPTVANRVHKINFDPSELRTLVGSYERTMSFSPSDGSTVTLIIQSQTPFGVKSVNAPLFPPGVGRLNSNISLRVETQQAVEAGQAFEWNVSQASGASATGCFEAINGTFTPPTGSATFSLPLTVKEVAGCLNRDYRVDVSAAGSTGGSLYERNVTFTLPDRSQVRGTGNVTDDRVKIQGQTPIIRR